jgi:hypothetical protein
MMLPNQDGRYWVEILTPEDGFREIFHWCRVWSLSAKRMPKRDRQLFMIGLWFIFDDRISAIQFSLNWK